MFFVMIVITMIFQLVILTISVIVFFMIEIAGINELRMATIILIKRISKKLNRGNVNLIGN